MKSVDYLRKSRLQAHLAEDRLLRHGSTGHGHQVRLRRQPRSAHHRRFRRRHRHEPLEHDAELGRARPSICTPRPMSMPASWPPRARGLSICPLPAVLPWKTAFSRHWPLAHPIVKTDLHGPGHHDSRLPRRQHRRCAPSRAAGEGQRQLGFAAASVADIGTIPRKRFASYFDVQKKVGKDEMKKSPTAQSPCGRWPTNWPAAFSSCSPGRASLKLPRSAATISMPPTGKRRRKRGLPISPMPRTKAQEKSLLPLQNDSTRAGALAGPGVMHAPLVRLGYRILNQNSSAQRPPCYPTVRAYLYPGP